MASGVSSSMYWGGLHDMEGLGNPGVGTQVFGQEMLVDGVDGASLVMVGWWDGDKIFSVLPLPSKGKTYLFDGPRDINILS